MLFRRCCATSSPVGGVVEPGAGGPTGVENSCLKIIAGSRIGGTNSSAADQEMLLQWAVVKLSVSLLAGSLLKTSERYLVLPPNWAAATCSIVGPPAPLEVQTMPLANVDSPCACWPPPMASKPVGLLIPVMMLMSLRNGSSAVRLGDMAKPVPVVVGSQYERMTPW